MSTLVALLPYAMSLGCDVDPAVEERVQAAADPGPGAEIESQIESVSRTGTLSVDGGALAAPGDYELRTSCSYDRRHGAFSLGMHPDVGAEVSRGPATFGISAGSTLRSRMPLEDGTYDARFEYTEVAGDGAVPTFRGEARLTVEVIDDARERFPILDVEASGEGDGVRFEVKARCQATVMG